MVISFLAYKMAFAFLATLSRGSGHCLTASWTRRCIVNPCFVHGHESMQKVLRCAHCGQAPPDAKGIGTYFARHASDFTRHHCARLQREAGCGFDPRSRSFSTCFRLHETGHFPLLWQVLTCSHQALSDKNNATLVDNVWPRQLDWSAILVARDVAAEIKALKGIHQTYQTIRHCSRSDYEKP